MLGLRVVDAESGELIGSRRTLMLLFDGISGKGAIHDWATRSTVTLTR